MIDSNQTQQVLYLLNELVKASKRNNDVKEFELQARAKHVQALERKNEIEAEYNYTYLEELKKSNRMEQAGKRLELELKEKDLEMKKEELEMKERELELKKRAIEAEEDKVSEMRTANSLT